MLPSLPSCSLQSAAVGKHHTQAPPIANFIDSMQTFDLSYDALDARAVQAAQCLGWRAILSDKRDDGHWGGFQLRIGENGIAAGYGFELSPLEVLEECRGELAPD